MRICWITSESHPYAKTGGLADVSGALPAALARRGHHVSVIMPFYPQVMKSLTQKTKIRLDLLGVPLGWWTEWAQLREEVINENLTYYFIEFNRFFDRPSLYDYYGMEYPDNAERFIFFCRAAMQTILACNLRPEILHTHDWHASLCSVYLRSPVYWSFEDFSRCASVLTIHNLGYQGIFHKSNMMKTGLSWDYFNYTCFEFYEQMNFLKAGIMTSDMVTTVSPTYAEEIQTADFGFAMDGALRHVKFHGKLHGILNGIDTEQWNPAKDPLIPARYDVNDLSGKLICKRMLQERFNLAPRPDVPIFGVVTRLAHQKGMDVFIDSVWELMDKDDIQIIVLGSGDSILERRVSEFCEWFPGKFGAFVGYSENISHLIEAGSDFFVMPSRYEPCGLNQMYSLRYGTLPVVRRTGGLADTVTNYDPASIDKSNGYTFDMLDQNAVRNTMRWAAGIYKFNRENHNKMIRNGMNQDFSWNHTAELYEDVYRQAIHRKSGA